MDGPRSGEPEAELTVLLNRMQRGDKQSAEKAIDLVYRELHQIAAREMRRERPGHALQTTALIHELYVRLAGAKALQLQSRAHFFALASQQMRRILVDFARAGSAQRRGGGLVPVDLQGIDPGLNPRSIDLLLLDEALVKLQDIDPRAAQVVEMRFFGGYGESEVAEVLGVSCATVRRDWEFARSWLFDCMHGDGHASRG